MDTLLDAATMLEDVKLEDAAPPRTALPPAATAAVRAAREVLKLQHAKTAAAWEAMERQHLPEAWKCFEAALQSSTKIDGLVGVLVRLHDRFLRAAKLVRECHASRAGAHMEVLQRIDAVLVDWVKALHLCAQRAAPYLEPVDLRGLLHTALVMVNAHAKSFAKSDACRRAGRTTFIMLWDCTARDAAKAVGRSRPEGLKHLMMASARGRA